MDESEWRTGDVHGLTALLQRMQRGDRDAGEKAMSLVYNVLHGIASRQLHGERPGHLLQTTALIHEAYARLMQAKVLDIQNRNHFFAIASRQMRRILVDYARANKSLRRGGGTVCVGLDGVQINSKTVGFDLLALDDALRDLLAVDERAAKVVELKFFGGYTDQEVAAALEASLTTVRRDWEFARSWLYARIKDGSPAGI